MDIISHYVDHVMQYYNSGNGSVVVMGDSSQSFDVEEVHNIMKQYLSRPYVWGGRTPAAGGYDCSGLLEYAFSKVVTPFFSPPISQGLRRLACRWGTVNLSMPIAVVALLIRSLKNGKTYIPS